jgi:hypothetical protein
LIRDIAHGVMWLIDTHKLILCGFIEPPPYAVLSHRWRDEKITFGMMQQSDPDHFEHGPDLHIESRKRRLENCAGGNKIIHACEKARQDGIDWIWIDTCCIDKTSSAELSEAINSMYRWYRQSKVCYAFLDHNPWTESDWFERGWTLQELLAPGDVRFLDANWDLVGTRVSSAELISERTGIDAGLLRGSPSSMLSQYSVAQRMAWAAHRKTTRLEDRAYSLMGLFDVTMPLIYGEGERAFERLQEQIIQSSDDQTILAWDRYVGPDTTGPQALLAPRPDCFAGLHKLVAIRDAQQPGTAFSLGKAGLSITMPFLPEWNVGVLACGEQGDPCPLGLSLKPFSSMDNVFACRARSYERLPMDISHNTVQKNLVVVRQNVPRPHTLVSFDEKVFHAWFAQAKSNAWTKSNLTYPLRMTSHHPQGAWDTQKLLFRLGSWTMQSAGAVFTYSTHGQRVSRNRWRETFAVNVCFAVYQPKFSDDWESLGISLAQNSAISVNYAKDVSVDQACKTLMEKLAIRHPENADLDQSAQIELQGLDRKPTLLIARMMWKLISATPTLEIGMSIIPSMTE